MDEDERAELVRQLFALLTGKFEDGAAIAADGQAGGVSPADQRALAQRLHEQGGECMIVADAIVALTESISAVGDGTSQN